MRSMKNKNSSAVSCMRGITLVELMVALVVTGLLLGGLYTLFSGQEKSAKSIDLTAEMQQNLRVALDVLTRDIRMAGFGVTLEDGTIRASASTCATGTPPCNGILVTDGGGANPDQLDILYADASVYGTVQGSVPSTPPGVVTVRGELVCDFAKDDVVILTDGTNSSIFQLTDDPTGCTGTCGDADNECSIEMDGTSAWNSGHTGFPSGGYGPNSLLYRAAYRVYRIDNTTDPARPTLMVDNYNTAWPPPNSQPLAEDIEDLQMEAAGTNARSYTVVLTARWREPIGALGAGASGEYRARTVTTRVRVRNIP